MLSLLCNRYWEAAWRGCGGIWCCWPPRSSLSIGIEHAIARCMMITMMQMYQYKWKENFTVLCFWSMLGSYLRGWLLVIRIFAGCFQGNVRTVIRAVMDSKGLTVQKNVFTKQTAEIRWILLNCDDGSIQLIKTEFVKLFFLSWVLISRSHRLLTVPLVNLYSLFYEGGHCTDIGPVF